MARINIFLLLLVVMCALGAVNSNHRARKLFTELEAEQKRLRDLDVEWGQLQLEQSTWSGHARIEKIAREKLGMRTPLPGQVMLVESSNDAPSKATALPKAD
ncbi:MAG: cell division protein FtsL [Rhodocyclaceae bacterium]|nr:cell division protein FtsL [Rhodocyclaceae bacterium]MBP6109490.1 cell division protein FtsL [Rhodocyclaceae bacterium]MBP6278626.1 cell division protein FtsL [Rhodocyclaceae bacterium]